MTAKLPKISPPILKVAIAVPIFRLFDYLAPENAEAHRLKPGIRVEVPFGKSIKTAYLVELGYDSSVHSNKLKTAIRLIDDDPLLSPEDLALIHWVSRYYHHPLGEVFSTAFPATLRKGGTVGIAPPKPAYELTETGKAAQACDLKKSPKQLKLLGHFQKQPSAIVTESDLALWDKNWRAAAKALLEKNFIVPSSAAKRTSESLKHMPERPKNPEASEYTALPPNPEQQQAIDAILDNTDKFTVYLLEGVTGSGKTEVYMQVIQSVLARGRQVLVLVPEINLTPQLEERFRKRFSVAMALFHSNLPHKPREDAWLGMQQGVKPILLGTRSALFTPMKNPGLIILDEEHDASFKQQDGLRFSARDVAIMRAKLLDIPVLLGTATPSLESLHNANQKRYRHLRLTKRAGSAVEPAIHLLDIRNKKMTAGLSETLIEEIRKVLANHEQVLLFLNRRGFAPTLICHGCGWVGRCGHCDANLVIHYAEKQLRCHHCGKNLRLPTECPSCKSGELMPLGLGTERIEDALPALFPGQSLVRLDRDTTQRKGALERYLRQINEGQADIILGTQMLAKGHHFDNVTLVAMIDADSGLFSIDFRATERLAQTIIQVAGRAGRAEKKGKVILQTRHPDHPMLALLIREGYGRFAESTLTERKQASLPPFSYQALIRAQARNQGEPFEFLQTVGVIAKTNAKDQIQVLGPAPAPMEKRASYYRYQLLLQSKNRHQLQKQLNALIGQIDALKPSKTIRWSLDVDPLDLF